MGLDGLGSSAYGPEAALTILIPLGAQRLHLIRPVMCRHPCTSGPALPLIPANDRGLSEQRELLHHCERGTLEAGLVFSVPT